MNNTNLGSVTAVNGKKSATPQNMDPGKFKFLLLPPPPENMDPGNFCYYPPPTESIRAKLVLPPPQMDVGPYAYDVDYDDDDDDDLSRVISSSGPCCRDVSAKLRPVLRRFACCRHCSKRIFSPLETIFTSLWASLYHLFQDCLLSVMSAVSSYLVIFSVVVDPSQSTSPLLLFPGTTVSIIFHEMLSSSLLLTCPYPCNRFCLRNVDIWHTLASSCVIWFLT